MDSFKIQGPALISFSGGRTSAYMLWRILQAHGGTLPDDVRVTFANTGKEMPQTLDFVQACEDRWGCSIQWLEYKEHAEPQQRWRRVNGDPSRDGEPFKAVIRNRQYLPNPVTRFCTIELKIRPMKLYAQSLGWKDWVVAIGLRADEQRRVASTRARSGKEGWENLTPLATAGITKADVVEFWSKQNFDLNLPNIGGVTPHGNCDLCFLKSAATIGGIMRDLPDRAQWWIEAEAEAEALASKPSGARFRNDRPSYAEMFKAMQEQRAFDFGIRDEITDCFCGEAS
jgi:3'-phosphoadenosine 5'-phosphosulfate sulfotransferase (PAPS reductase)/FAD synthetase